VVILTISCQTISIYLPIFFLMQPPTPTPTLFPYTTLFRSCGSTRSRRTTSCWASSRSSCSGDLVNPAGPPQPQDLVFPDEPFRRSEEHTSELQSRGHLVCRLLLEKKKNVVSWPFR